MYTNWSYVCTIKKTPTIYVIILLVASIEEPNTNITCISCDSKSSFDCETSVRKQDRCKSTTNKCFTALYEDRRTLVRGCDAAPDPELYTFGTGANQIEVCEDGDNCNSKRIEMESCFPLQYERSAVIRGRSFHEIVSKRICPLGLKPMGCYALINSKGSEVRSGCVSDMALGRDKQAHNEEIFNCMGKSCNKKFTFLACLSHDANDHIHLNAMPTNAKFNVCEAYDKCFTYVHNEQTAERGCLSKASAQVRNDCAHKDKRCSLCNDSIGCNRYEAKERGEGEEEETFETEPESEDEQELQPEVQPEVQPDVPSEIEPKVEQEVEVEVQPGKHEASTAEPMYCYKCDSSVNPTCSDNPSSSETCKSEHNECFTALYHQYSTLVRGCIGDPEPYYPARNPDQIQLCSSALCNNHQVADEKCHSFKYTKDDVINGMQRRWRFPPTKCHPVLNPLGCYYLIHTEGHTVKTGCRFSIRTGKVNQANNEHLETCIGDECDESTTFLSCLAHGPSDSFEMNTETADVRLERCTDQCFTYTHGAASVERGCLANASQKISDDCAANNRKCALCDDDIGCNREEAQWNDGDENGSDGGDDGDDGDNEDSTESEIELEPDSSDEDNNEISANESEGKLQPQLETQPETQSE